MAAPTPNHDALVLTMDILSGQTLTGAAMNPARYFGTALASNHLGDIVVYLVGPIVGAILGWAVYVWSYEEIVSRSTSRRFHA